MKVKKFIEAFVNIFFVIFTLSYIYSIFVKENLNVPKIYFISLIALILVLTLQFFEKNNKKEKP